MTTTETTWKELTPAEQAARQAKAVADAKARYGLTIPAGNCLCWKCNGSGRFYSGGAVVNGRYTGKVGTCYPCQGKGYQTPADTKRTNYYYAHVYRVAL